MANHTDNIEVLNVTTGTVGGVFDVSMRTHKSLHFLNTESTAGVVTFTVHVSNDGHEFIAYNRLISNATTTAFVANIALSSLTNAGVLFIPHDDYFRYIRVTATKSAQTTAVNGTYKCIMQTSS
jgi:hypothetical protein